MGGVFGLDAREFLNLLEAMLRADIRQMYAGHPQEMEEALEDLDEALSAGGTLVLSGAEREAAWARLGG